MLFMYISVVGYSQMDSTVSYSYTSVMDSVPQYKYIYEYDQLGNQTQMIFQTWDEFLFVWQKQNKETRAYDGANLTLILTEGWYGTEWIAQNKFVYVYEDGLLKSDTIANWIMNDGWAIQTFHDYDYNSGVLSKVVSYNGNSPVTKQIFSYNGSDLILETVYTWTQPNWYIHSRTFLYYTGSLDSTVFYKFTSVMDSAPLYKQIFEYDQYGNETQLLIQDWNDFFFVWDNRDKEVKTYEGNNLTSVINYGWNQSQWYAGHKYVYVYENDLLISDSTYFYYQFEGWGLMSCTGYQYNNNNVLTEVIYDSGPECYPDSKTTYSYNGANLIAESHFIMSVQSWHINNRRFYYYTGSNGIRHSLNPKFRIYPNPTTGKVNFESPVNYEVFDLTGKQIQKGYGSQTTIEDKGTYIIKIYNELGTISRKVVKQ